LEFNLKKLKMRNKIDYGIDLGTTNSAIARMENGMPAIKKSETLKDTIPSCVHFNKKQITLVGDQAYNAMHNDFTKALATFESGTTNSFIEFKRTMGTTHTESSLHMGKTFNSEELSAEVLKKLKSLVDENISAVVITVPAKFLNPQNEATMNAARMAGFKHVQLLQEPVAAATAYGLGASNKSGYWLVFDFGGGTFDAALVKSAEGILSVKDTDGDNWLGGKNIDEAIIDQLIIPHLQEKFSIESVVKNQSKKEILRNALRKFAEEAKIQLSFKDSFNILSNLGDLKFKDDNGEEPEIDLTLTVIEMERVAGPLFQKAIDISKQLLQRNNLKGSDLSAVILVGGPTYSPILRKMVKEQISDKVDTSVDPMTVVARGAALFASTVPVPEEIKEETRDKTKLQLDLKYESTTVEEDEMISIKVLKEKSIGTYQGQIYANIVWSDGGWSGGKKQIGEKVTIFDVLLKEGPNSFDIHIYDEAGNKLECQPHQFNILRGIGGLNSMQVLPYHIGIAKYFDSEEKDLFMPVKGLEKNKKFPATGVINGLKTRSGVRPGMAKDIIRIPIYQGDYNAAGTTPSLNNLITEVIINGESLPAVLPEGSDVDITIKVDKSQIMQFSAYFPLLDHTEELKIEIKITEPPKIEILTKEIAKAKRTAQSLAQHDVSDSIIELEKQLENATISADGKLQIQDALRKELIKLEQAEKSAMWPKLSEHLKEVFFNLESLIEKIKARGHEEGLNMEAIEAHLEEYKQKIELIIREKNVMEAKILTREIRLLDFEIRNIASGNGLDVQELRRLNDNFNSYHWKDASRSRQLINRGMQMVAEGKTAEIRTLIFEIYNLMPEDERPETLG
jgi:molecular chaperone DnaK